MERGRHAPGPPGGLRGRTSECALLDDLVSAIRRGESRSLVLRGEPGIGKTALLEYLIAMAPDATVVRAVGVLTRRLLVGVLVLGHERQLREVQPPEAQLEVAAVGDQLRRLQRLGQLGKQPRHLSGALEVVLAALHARTFATKNGDSQRRTRRPTGPLTVDRDDAALLERAHAARNGAKFAALWRGDVSGYPSQSEADLALCNRLAWWTDYDAARVDALFRRSGLWRPKWDERHGEQTYGERTIAMAIAG